MTIIAAPLPLPASVTDLGLATVTDHPGRVAQRRRVAFRDGKLALIAGVESLDGCRRHELEALGRTADLVRVEAGTVLANGYELSRQWWMPVEGWLLAEGDGVTARPIPAGWSWVAPRIPAIRGRLTALRPSAVLVAPVHRVVSMLDEYPALGTAVRATLVGGDV